MRSTELGVMGIGKILILTFSDSEEHIINRIREIVEDEDSMEYAQVSMKNILTFPGLEIHIHEQHVYQNPAFIPMSHHEFFTLLYLEKHPNWVFSKVQIYEAVWKESGDGGTAVTNVVRQQLQTW